MIGTEIKEKLLGEDCLTDIMGQESAKEQVKSALLSGRNIIIAGPPGVGKTTLAKNVAKLLPPLKVNDCGYNCLPSNPVCPECRGRKTGTRTISGLERFVRIQGSPDLTSEDLLGDIDPVKALKFGPSSPEAFTPGKIFLANNGVLFFD
ncbi:ATP-binding protein, partial [Candidatus Woesearchaeota archaeon]|nr:ATP-binding protein [Candidatus Woesearchaeota archaeon]